jgi:hypothetical protein
MRTGIVVFAGGVLLAGALLLTSSAGMAGMGGNLRVEGASGVKVEGRFHVVLFGGQHSDDVETVAFLDVADDGLRVVPKAPEFRYKVRKDVEAADAVAHAEEFVQWHRSANGLIRRQVLGPSGRVVAYEIRPLYRPFDLGARDVMFINYWLEGENIRVRIRLRPEVERVLQGDDLDRPVRGPFR